MIPSLEILTPGSGLTMQDLGRPGWKRFGLPPGGAMDADSASVANLLVGNEPGDPLLELAFTGARLRALRRCEIAITGAGVACSHPLWRNVILQSGEEVAFTALRSGVWTYLALAGGFEAPVWFGSASAYPRAGLGGPLGAGLRLLARPHRELSGISGRFIREAPDFQEKPRLSVWRGPEWEHFPAAVREQFFEEHWTVSPQSDRSGYHLQGRALGLEAFRMPSSPTAVGVIQVPPGGSPIVLLRDGPTVGGYPRLAILDPSAISRFTQCAPGTAVQFQLLE